MRTLMIGAACLYLAACGDLNLGDSFRGNPPDASLMGTDAGSTNPRGPVPTGTETDTETDPAPTDPTTTDETDPEATETASDLETTDTEPEPPECTDACEAGRSVCSAGQITRCESADGCLAWSQPTACAMGECATAESCEGCVDVCETSEALCEAGLFQSCQLGPNGCNVWSEPSPCEFGSCADDGSCRPCQDECDEPLACADGSTIACRRGADGCLVLDAAECPEPVLSGNGEACTRDSECIDDSCLPTIDNLSICCAEACDDDQVCADDGTSCVPALTCAAGDVRCSNGDHQGCVDGQWVQLDDCSAGCSVEHGCLPSAGEACPVDNVCGEGSCQAASNGEQICCTANCGGSCKSCASDGKSCVNEADDSACGTVSCPDDSACRDYTESSVTSGRCLDGQCASPEQLCAFTPRGAGQACSATHLCDTAGNCSVPKLALGNVCDAEHSCGSGFCVDGVCCENACDGPCMACRLGTGQCDVVPLQDTGCAPVDCSGFNTECSSSEGIGDGQCRQLGVCKTADDCQLDFAPRGTSCRGVPQVCDGQGNCEQPEVQCGSTSCTTGFTGDACCYTSTAPGVTTPACIDQNDPCIESATDWLVLCDEQEDCRTGENICCLLAGSTFRQVQCMEPENCNYLGTQGFSALELCESPLMSKRACSLGTECSAAEDTMPGFTFCTLP